MTDLATRYGKWALVAGASEGLGAAIAAASARMRRAEAVTNMGQRSRALRQAGGATLTRNARRHHPPAEYLEEEGMALVIWHAGRVRDGTLGREQGRWMIYTGHAGNTYRQKEFPLLLCRQEGRRGILSNSPAEPSSMSSQPGDLRRPVLAITLRA